MRKRREIHVSPEEIGAIRMGNGAWKMRDK